MKEEKQQYNAPEIRDLDSTIVAADAEITPSDSGNPTSGGVVK